MELGSGVSSHPRPEAPSICHFRILPRQVREKAFSAGEDTIRGHLASSARPSRAVSSPLELTLIKTASFVPGRWVRRLLCVSNSERPNQHNATQAERPGNPIWNCHLLRLQIQTTSLQGRARAFNPPALPVRFRSIPDGYIGDHDDLSPAGDRVTTTCISPHTRRPARTENESRPISNPAIGRGPAHHQCGVPLDA